MTKEWLEVRSAFWKALLKDCPGNISLGVGVLASTPSTYVVVNELIPFKLFKWVLWYSTNRLMHITQSEGDKKCFIVGHMENYHYKKEHRDFWWMLHTVAADQGLRIVSQWGAPLPHAEA